MIQMGWKEHTLTFNLFRHQKWRRTMIENPRLVVDVSHYDDHLDAQLLKKAGVAAVIV